MGGGERNSVEENSLPARTMRLRHPTPMNCVLARSTASDRSGSWHRPSNAPCNSGFANEVELPVQLEDDRLRRLFVDIDVTKRVIHLHIFPLVERAGLHCGRL